MRKLLIILTTITSLSSITPIVLANTSVKIKENKIINNEINYLQTDNKSASLHLENTNNYSWLDTISAFWEIGIKKYDEAKDYLLEKVENIKNGLENLTINDLLKLFENKKIQFL